ncbi:MAG: hypothetical protein MI750_15750 [Xanthomonadales bacterium]|jgi:hypothetical protein|nr:hypothetical protein [Xanthomonadales bacterium]
MDTERKRLILRWLIVNSLLLLAAIGVWMWGEYRYIKLYRPPEELRQLSEAIIYALPVLVLAANLFMLRKLCIHRHLIWSVMTTIVLTAIWWGFFHTLGVQWHLSLGGTLT